MSEEMVTKPGECPYCGEEWDEAVNENGYVTYDHEQEDGTVETCGSEV